MTPDWVFLSLGVALGASVYKWIATPLWETVAVLRKELAATRRDLHEAEITIRRLSVQVMDDFRDKHVGLTPPPGWEVLRSSLLERDGLSVRPLAVPRRAHSDVLFIPRPEDLLK